MNALSARLGFWIDTVSNGQFARYVVAGIINTIIGFFLYALCIGLFQAPFWLANAASLVGGILSGFLLAHIYVYKKIKRSLAASGWRYVTAIVAQYLISTAMIGMFVTYGFSKIAGYLLALPAMVLVSFLLQKMWVFRSEDNTTDRAFEK